jgi:hypothetical protein
MHQHLRRLGRIWIDAPIYFVTACTKHRRQVLASDSVAGILIEEWGTAQERHWWAVGRYVISGLIMCISFAGLAPMPRHCLSLWERGKVGRAVDFVNCAGRGQRPRLQRRFGNANSSITYFALMKATRRNGIMFGTIPFELVWFSRRPNGNMPVKLKR